MTSHSIRIDMGACNNYLPIVSGGIELAPKCCIREKGHTGPHSDGQAVWINIAHHNNVIDRRFSAHGS